MARRLTFMLPARRALAAAGAGARAAANAFGLPDVLLAAGTAAVGYGVALVYLPAALITVGALLLAGGLRLAAAEPSGPELP